MEVTLTWWVITLVVFMSIIVGFLIAAIMAVSGRASAMEATHHRCPTCGINWIGKCVDERYKQ